MPKPKIAFLSMDNLEEFVCYDFLVRDVLLQKGIEVIEVPWRKANVNWDDFDLVLIRSPWDYQQAPALFLTVLEQIDQSKALLLNSLPTVRWNMQKTYLKDIEASGASIVPTSWLDSPAVDDLQQLFAQLNVEQVVVKPVVGANADHAYWLTPSSDRARFEQASNAFRGTIALAQPFVESIQSFGEISLIFFEDEFSHAVRKKPTSGDFRVQEEHGGVIEQWLADSELIDFARQCLAACPEQTLYSRVDVVFLQDRQPAVMEVELIEPSLYLTYCDEAADRFADAIVRALPRA